MSDRKTDPAIEQIEAELRESRFKAWDVETFLANRYQAKIDALTKPQSRWKSLVQVVKDLSLMFCALVGYLTVMVVAGGWLLTGEFPLSRQAVAEYRACHIDSFPGDPPPPLYPNNPIDPR